MNYQDIALVIDAMSDGIEHDTGIAFDETLDAFVDNASAETWTILLATARAYRNTPAEVVTEQDERELQEDLHGRPSVWRRIVGAAQRRGRK